MIGSLLLLDAAIIGGIPLILIAIKRPKSALLLSIVIGGLVIVDGMKNFDEISYPKVYPFRLLALPAGVLPLSIFLILATIGLCLWAVDRDMR